MKKILSIFLTVLMMTLLFASCGQSKNVEKEKDESNYVFLDEPLGTESYAIGFRKNDTELAEQVSGAVKALVKNGTYDKIGEKYPDIKDYLFLNSEDISEDEIAVEGSGDSEFVFKHGFDLDYPPYSYLQDDGTVGGFDVEMAQAVCEYLGWKYEPVPFNWDAKDAELNAGSCDCIWSGFTKEGREDDYLWGITYSNNTIGILVKEGSGITVLSDLEGKNVGVQTSTSAYDMLDGDMKDFAEKFQNLQVYETYTIALSDLKAGAIDAIAIDMTAGTFLISNENKKTSSQYVFIDEPLGTESYAIGFRKNDTELAEQVSGAVKALVKNGTYDKIGEKYPDIKDYLFLNPEDISEDEIAVEGSGDSEFVFKHGFDLDYPPYSYLQDDGTVGGFDVEMAQAVCEYLGWKYEPVPFNWDAKDAELNAGSCDCIWSGFTKEGREDDYLWGITYSNNTIGILVKEGSGITVLSDLEGKNVGVQTSTSAYDMLDGDMKDFAEEFQNLQVYETYTIALSDLKAGAIDAIAIDMTAGTFLISNESENDAESSDSWSLITILKTMAQGMGRTITIFLLTLVGSLPLGMIVALLRKSKIKVISMIVRGYISVIRGTPLMLQLLVWYFGPYYLFDISIDGWRFPAIVLGFVLNYAAYFAEIYRSGIESMPIGQYEAAQVLGYSKAQTFFKIILPQVIKRILPSVTNEVITLVKDTSLAFTLAYQEVFSLAKQISASQTSFVPFVVAGIFYFVANYVVEFIMERIGKSMDYYK